MNGPRQRPRPVECMCSRRSKQLATFTHTVLRRLADPYRSAKRSSVACVPRPRAQSLTARLASMSRPRDARHHDPPFMRDSVDVLPTQVVSIVSRLKAEHETTPPHLASWPAGAMHGFGMVRCAPAGFGYVKIRGSRIRSLRESAQANTAMVMCVPCNIYRHHRCCFSSTVQVLPPGKK